MCSAKGNLRPIERFDLHCMKLLGFTGDAAVKIREANRREAAERRFEACACGQPELVQNSLRLTLKDSLLRLVIQDDDCGGLRLNYLNL
jgi:hypothetical protein